MESRQGSTVFAAEFDAVATALVEQARGFLQGTLTAFLGADIDDPHFVEHSSVNDGTLWRLCDSLRRWDDGGRDALAAFELPHDLDDHHSSGVTAFWVLESIAPLAVEHAPTISAAQIKWPQFAISELARLFLPFEPHLSLTGALTATSIGIAWNLPADGLGPLLVEIARKHGDPQSRAFTNAYFARSLLSADSPSAAATSAAFDALEEALLQVHRIDDPHPILALLVPELSDERFRSLRPLATSAVREDLDPGLRSLLGRIADPIWKSTDDGSVADQLAAIRWTVEIEDDRAALDPVDLTEPLSTSWSTWTFDHPALRQAIPQGATFDENDRTLLLELAHELTHIQSIRGGLGLASLSYRHATLLHEVWLHTEASRDGEGLPSGATPLTHPDLRFLLATAQIADLTHKRQIVEAVWAPWLEGIAVMGELASDGRRDPNFSPISEVMAHLADVAVSELAAKNHRSVQEEWERAVADSEERYADAIAAEGHFRLRTYLGPARFDKYGPGYLVVRAVVSRWRETLGGDLDGSSAFRILLHATRTGTATAIPDSDLCVEEFQLEAIRLMLDWIDGLSDVPAATLHRFDGESEFDGHWEDGVLKDSNENTADRMFEIHMERIRQGLAHIPDVLLDEADDPHTVALFRSAAEGIAGYQPDPELVRDLFRLESQELALLPIATADAPFWLLDGPEPMLFTMVRRRERDSPHQRGKYAVVRQPITQHEAVAIQASFTEGGPRRMRVTRYADLAPADASGGRGFGRHVLATSYGSTTLVTGRGLLPSLHVAEGLQDGIRSRQWPTDLMSLGRGLADGRASAKRTRRWLDAIGDRHWRLENQALPQDLSGAVRRVSDLTSTILDFDASPLAIDAGRLALERALGTNAPKSLADLVAGGAAAEPLRFLVNSGVRRGEPAPPQMSDAVDLAGGGDIRPHRQKPKEHP